MRGYGWGVEGGAVHEGVGRHTIGCSTHSIDQPTLYEYAHTNRPPEQRAVRLTWVTRAATFFKVAERQSCCALGLARSSDRTTRRLGTMAATALRVQCTSMLVSASPSLRSPLPRGLQRRVEPLRTSPRFSASSNTELKTYEMWYGSSRMHWQQRNSMLVSYVPGADKRSTPRPRTTVVQI